MAGIRLEINLAGLERVSGLLAELAKNVSDLKPALKSIGEHIVSQAKMNFRDERGPDGKDWKKSRRAEKEDGQTLSLTARLKNSINYRVNDDSVTVGTSVSYAAVHQLGFTGSVQISAHERRITQAFGRKLKKRKTVSVRSHTATRNIPARPFLPRSMEEIGAGAVERIIVRHLIKE